MKKRKSINSKSSTRHSKTRFSLDFDRPPHHPSAPPARHFFQGESLARGIEAAFGRGDTLLFAGQARGIATSDILSVSGEIIAENNYAIEVHLEVKCVARKSYRQRLVVARNDQELALLVKAEARHLASLAPRLPKIIVPPLALGILFLPDRHRRTGQNRRIAAYATRAVPDSLYCGIGGPEQLRAYASTPKLLSRDATDSIKGRILEICLRSFDPRARTAMPPPDLQRGTLRLAARRASGGEIVITGCPYLWDHLDHVGLIHRLTGFDWKEGDNAMPLLPADHRILREALITAIGKAAARDWTKDYATALDQCRYKPHHRFGLEDLSELRESLAR